MHTPKSAGGFTLIELVIVIVILGILSAFALPRFANLSSDARVSTLEGAMASVRSATAIAHSAYLTAGNSPSSVTMDGTSIALTNGYPSSTSIASAAGLASTDFTVDTTTTAGTAVVQVAGAPTPASCSFSYTQAAAATTPPTFSVITSTGC